MASARAALSRLGAKKGAAAGAVAVAIRRQVLAEALPEHADVATRIRKTKDSAYRNASRLETLAMQAAEDAMGEIGGVGALRALDLAASVLARVRPVKWAALGLDGRSPPDGELAELVVRVMTEKEIAIMREEQLAEQAEQAVQAVHAMEPDAAAAVLGADQHDVVTEDDHQPPHMADAGTGRIAQRGSAVGADLNEFGRVGGHDG